MQKDSCGTTKIFNLSLTEKKKKVNELIPGLLFSSYAKDLIKDTIQRNASPVRLEQGGSDKGGIGGSSSSLNSSASDESNRLHQQQHHQQQASRFRSTLLHSFSTNDASIGEYKYTVTVGNHSLKITGSNLDLVRV